MFVIFGSLLCTCFSRSLSATGPTRGLLDPQSSTAAVSLTSMRMVAPATVSAHLTLLDRKKYRSIWTVKTLSVCVLLLSVTECAQHVHQHVFVKALDSVVFLFVFVFFTNATWAAIQALLCPTLGPTNHSFSIARIQIRVTGKVEPFTAYLVHPELISCQPPNRQPFTLKFCLWTIEYLQLNQHIVHVIGPRKKAGLSVENSLKHKENMSTPHTKAQAEAWTHTF